MSWPESSTNSFLNELILALLPEAGDPAFEGQGKMQANNDASGRAAPTGAYPRGWTNGVDARDGSAARKLGHLPTNEGKYS